MAIKNLKKKLVCSLGHEEFQIKLNSLPERKVNSLPERKCNLL